MINAILQSVRREPEFDLDYWHRFEATIKGARVKVDFHPNQIMVNLRPVVGFFKRLRFRWVFYRLRRKLKSA